MNDDLIILTKKWFEFADNDLSVAIKISDEFNFISCFHCQQAAEKYIKGLLVFLQINFRKSHNLTYLLELLTIEIPSDIFEAAEYLNEFSVEVRYPGDYEEITVEETNLALEYTRKIKDFIFDITIKNGFTLLK